MTTNQNLPTYRNENSFNNPMNPMIPINYGQMHGMGPTQPYMQPMPINQPMMGQPGPIFNSPGYYQQPSPIQQYPPQGPIIIQSWLIDILKSLIYINSYPKNFFL